MIQSEETNRQAYNFIKNRRRYFNISSIETACGLVLNSLLNAIYANAEQYEDSNKLIPFLDKFYPAWKQNSQL